MVCLTIIDNGKKTYFTKNSLSVDDLCHEALIALSNVNYSTLGNSRQYSHVLVYYLNEENMTSYLHFDILASYSVSESLLRFNVTVKQSIKVPGYTYRFNVSDVKPFNLTTLDIVKDCHEAFKEAVNKNREDKESKQKEFLQASSSAEEVA